MVKRTFISIQLQADNYLVNQEAIRRLFALIMPSSSNLALSIQDQQFSLLHQTFIQLLYKYYKLYIQMIPFLQFVFIQYLILVEMKEQKQEQMMQMMQVSRQEWDRMQFQLRRLKQQNMLLRQKLRQEMSPLMTKNKSFMERILSSDTNIYRQYQKNNQKQKFKNEMSQWSKRMNIKKRDLKISSIKIDHIQNGQIQFEVQLKKEQPIVQQAKMINLFKTVKSGSQKSGSLNSPYRIEQPVIINQSPVKEMNEQENQKIQFNDQSKLIEAICLYGPEQIDLKKPTKTGRLSTPNHLLFINDQQKRLQYQEYREIFFPFEGVQSRRLNQSQIVTNCDQIIFKKNQKKRDSSLMMFQINQKLNRSNQILNRVNGIKRLGCFFIQFKDFLYLQVEDQNPLIKIHNKSMENLQIVKSLQQLSVPQVSRNRKKSDYINSLKKFCVKTVYTICVFTYFPFINVMQQILSSIMDQIKTRRIQKLGKQNNLQKVSIKYYIEQLNTLSNQIQETIQKIPMRIGQAISLKIGHFKILFNFMQNKINDLLFGGWVFEIIKKFDRELIIDIFFSIMTQESICFVCQDLNYLTQAVFFFVSVLPNPFQYPHPCISRVLTYELLDSPFVITLGLNQSSKWVQQNAIKYQKKIFIDLNGEQAKVKGKRKLSHPKSQKLRKIFMNMYKKLEGNSPMPQIFKKKQTIIRPVVRQQNQLIYSMLKNLQTYYSEQIFKHLPNPAIIDVIKQGSPERNENSKITSILKQIKKYLLQSRKQKEKDGFIQALVDQQIFYMYLAKVYELH